MMKHCCITRGKVETLSIFERNSRQNTDSYNCRCVICQMEYKRGDHQMTLPCKHIYHSCCVSKWLSLNKACPVCFVEVFVEEPSKH